MTVTVVSVVITVCVPAHLLLFFSSALPIRLLALAFWVALGLLLAPLLIAVVVVVAVVVGSRGRGAILYPAALTGLREGAWASLGYITGAAVSGTSFPG